MARRFSRRRLVIIGAIVVALSIGIVFSSLPYLQAPATPHGSIQTTLSHPVGPGTPAYPGFYALKIPNIGAPEPFAVNVSVNNGTASFCAMQYQPYFLWARNYNSTPSPGASFPYSDCNPQTQQTSQETLHFSVSPGTWVVVALNTGPQEETVYFSPA